MDELAEYNKERWEELAKANVLFSRPWLDLDEQSARKRVDPEGMTGEIEGKDVLCLAGGGGQQSAAFALLGARVTVLDICETQLERDREATQHYGTNVRTVQGDMRDLSCFENESFDIVWHAHSLTFVPDMQRVFDEIARILRVGGRYYLSWRNPFYHGTCEKSWSCNGYSLRLPYVDGTEVVDGDPCWDVEDGKDQNIRVKGPREFRHTLGNIINGLITRGFIILGLWEEIGKETDAEPGTWRHYETVAPPSLYLWAVLQPDVMKEMTKS